MTEDFLNTVTIDDRTYFWRDVSKTIDENEEHHYRVAELSLEKVYNSTPDIDFFRTDYQPPVYFAPVEILEQSDSAVVNWCENHGMYFD